MAHQYKEGDKSLSRYESQQVREIHDWKTEKPTVVSRTLGRLLDPVAKVVEWVIPEAAIMGALDLVNAAAKFTADSKDLLRKADVRNVAELRQLPLERNDELADTVHNWAIVAATGEGAVTGAGGLPAIPADIPALVFLSLRTIHKIGLCYGYELEREEDKQFAYAILQAVGANSMEEKIAALIALRAAQRALMNVAWKHMSNVGVQGALKLIRELAKQLGINITKRKALQAIPVIGGGIGAAVNGSYIRDIGWAARRAFQERKLIDEGKLVEVYGPHSQPVS